MTASLDDENKLSGRFQIRIGSDLHRDLLEFSNGVNRPMNDIVEASLMFSLAQRREEFLKFSDDYLNGNIMVVDNHMPIANIARRNLISFLSTGDNKLEISFKAKTGGTWGKIKIIADISQNPTLLERLNSWSRPSFI